MAPPARLNSKGFTVSLWVRFDFPEKHSEWKDIGDGAIICRDPIIGQDDGYAIRCSQLWVMDGQLLWHRMNEYSSVWTKWHVEKDKWYHVAASFDGIMGMRSTVRYRVPSRACTAPACSASARCRSDAFGR